MGVAGLWDVIQHTSETRSLTHLAVVDGFQQNTSGVRGYRIGIDASIWFFHAKSGREGENPELRLIFFRLAKLLSEPFLPLFVFDGPKRPKWKRGIQINKKPHWLLHGVKVMINAFGFEWRQAPGEAEAELAYLNRINIIDGILSDDVDNFLFGAKTVIRNPGRGLTGNLGNPALNTEGRDDGNHVRIFDSATIAADEKAGLNRAAFILMGLLSGGDYEEKAVPGSKLPNCGIKTAHALAKAGFGEELIAAFQTLDPDEFDSDYLPKWRDALRAELRTNSRGLLVRKEKKLSENVPDEFPNIAVLKAYVQPITTESLAMEKGRDPMLDAPRLDQMWTREHSLSTLAQFCEEKFEWGTTKIIPKRFRSLLWHGAVIRILRRAVLDLDNGTAIPGGRVRSTEKPRAPGGGEDDDDNNDHGLPVVPSTPKKKKNAMDLDARGGGVIGTPSKMITKYFATVSLNSPTKPRSSTNDDGEEDHPLIAKIASSTTTHASTDCLLEYRVEIDPHQLVGLTLSGIEGVREEPVDGGSDMSGEEGEGEDGEGKKKVKRKPTVVDAFSLHRIWVPGCMLEAVEGDLVRLYEEGKAKKGKKAPSKAKAKLPSSPTKAKLPVKSKGKPHTSSKPSIGFLSSDEDEDNALERIDLNAVPLTSESESDAPVPAVRKTIKSAVASTSSVRPQLGTTKSAGITPPNLFAISASRPIARVQSVPLPAATSLPPSSRPLGTSKAQVSEPSKGKGKASLVASTDDWDDLFPSIRPSTSPPLHSPSPRRPSPPSPPAATVKPKAARRPVAATSNTATASSSSIQLTKEPKKNSAPKRSFLTSSSESGSEAAPKVLPPLPKSPRKSKEQESPKRPAAQPKAKAKSTTEVKKKAWSGLSSSDSEPEPAPRRAAASPSPSSTPSPKKKSVTPPVRYDDPLDFFASPARDPGPSRPAVARAATTSSKSRPTGLLSKPTTAVASKVLKSSKSIIELSDSDSPRPPARKVASVPVGRNDETDSDDDSALHPSNLFLALGKPKPNPSAAVRTTSLPSKSTKITTTSGKPSGLTQQTLPLRVVKTVPGLGTKKKAAVRSLTPERRPRLAVPSDVIDLTTP